MKRFVSFINFLLFGNIFVAAGALALTYSSFIQINYSSQSAHLYIVLVFFSTLFIYNFQRFFYKKNANTTLHSIRREWIFTHQTTIKTIAIISIIGVLSSFWLNHNYKLLLYLSPLLIVSLLYFSFAELRKKPATKLLTLVSVWVITTSVIPIILSNNAVLTSSAILHIAARFCFMMAICIPFDIRDLAIDSADNITTLPQRIGEKKAISLAVIFIGIHATIVLFEFYVNFLSLQHILALLISASCTALLISKTKSTRNEYFFVAGLDGTMILQGFLILLASCCY
jgi:4-hydroxybenzoate polyprenyltransferase